MRLQSGAVKSYLNDILLNLNMPLRKELFEYVEVESLDLITSDLKRTSLDFRNAMHEVEEQLGADIEKHEAIEEAVALSKSLLGDIKLLNKDLLKPIFKSTLKEKEHKSTWEPKKVRIESSLDGRDALKHLRRNLSDLKQELGVE